MRHPEQASSIEARDQEQVVVREATNLQHTYSLRFARVVCSKLGLLTFDTSSSTERCQRPSTGTASLGSLLGMDVFKGIDNVRKAAWADTTRNGQPHVDLLEAIRKLNLAVETPAETLMRMRFEVIL